MTPWGVIWPNVALCDVIRRSFGVIWRFEAIFCVMWRYVAICGVMWRYVPLCGVMGRDGTFYSVM